MRKERKRSRARGELLAWGTPERIRLPESNVQLPDVSRVRGYARLRNLAEFGQVQIAAEDYEAAGTTVLARTVSSLGRGRIIHAPARQTAPPTIERRATCSWRSNTPRSNATGGMRNVAPEAWIAPTRPAATVKITFAMLVPNAPNAISDSTGTRDQCARGISTMPNGAVSRTAHPRARQITGSAP